MRGGCARPATGVRCGTFCSTCSIMRDVACCGSRCCGGGKCSRRRANGRLRYAKHCPVHGPVDAVAIVRGYEYGPGQHVVAQPDELDRLRPAQDKALRLERFLAPAQLDPLLFAGRSLYLVPDGKAAEPGYGVLRTALAQHQRWALGRMVLGGHRQVVLVRPASTNLVLHVLHYPEQVRVCPQTVWPLEKEPAEELRLAGM